MRRFSYCGHILALANATSRLAFREEMFRMLSHHVKESKCISASIGGHVDHVHLLVGLSRTISIATFATHDGSSLDI